MEFPSVIVLFTFLLVHKGESQEDCSHLPLSDQWMCASPDGAPNSVEPEANSDCSSLPLSEKWRCANPNGATSADDTPQEGSISDCSSLPWEERWKCSSHTDSVSLIDTADKESSDCSNLPLSEKWKCAKPEENMSDEGSAGIDCSTLDASEQWRCNSPVDTPPSEEQFIAPEDILHPTTGKIPSPIPSYGPPPPKAVEKVKDATQQNFNSKNDQQPAPAASILNPVSTLSMPAKLCEDSERSVILAFYCTFFPSAR